MRNFGTLRVKFINCKLQVANGKFRNCVAIINKVFVVRSLSSLRALARREGDRPWIIFMLRLLKSVTFVIFCDEVLSGWWKV